MQQGGRDPLKQEKKNRRLRVLLLLPICFLGAFLAWRMVSTRSESLPAGTKGVLPSPATAPEEAVESSVLSASPAPAVSDPASPPPAQSPSPSSAVTPAPAPMPASHPLRAISICEDNLDESLFEPAQEKGIVEPSAEQVSQAIIAIRQRKLPDPAVQGNAGSFFQNPTVTAEQMAVLKAKYPEMPSYPQPDGRFRIAAGWLIDQCGWKGRQLGQAGVCATQALVLVNCGDVKGREIAELAKAIQTDVQARFGLSLVPEPAFI